MVILASSPTFWHAALSWGSSGMAREREGIERTDELLTEIKDMLEPSIRHAVPVEDDPTGTG